VQLEPVEPMLKAPGTEHLKLKCAILLLTFAFKINLRRYNQELEHPSITSVLTSFKEAYETWWHAILKVRLGLPVDHDPQSLTPICWRHCCINVAGKTWAEAGAYTRPLFGSSKRFLWDRGCIKECLRGVQAALRGCLGVSRAYFVSESAQVELKRGQV